MFKKLFEYKILLFLYEILGVIITQFILLIYLPTKAEKIIEFIRDSSTDVNGIGHICSFAAFNIDYINGPYNENNLQLKSNDSKFEISYINFTEEYSTCID